MGAIPSMRRRCSLILMFKSLGFRHKLGFSSNKKLKELRKIKIKILREDSRKRKRN